MEASTQVKHFRHFVLQMGSWDSLWFLNHVISRSCSNISLRSLCISPHSYPCQQHHDRPRSRYGLLIQDIMADLILKEHPNNLKYQQYIYADTYHRRNISFSKIEHLMQIFQSMLGGNSMWMKRLTHEFIKVLCTSYI